MTWIPLSAASRSWMTRCGALDRFSEQAYQIVSSPPTRTAFYLSKEKVSESDRFGKHEFGQTLLLACRLIEAGVHFVTVRLRGPGPVRFRHTFEQFLEAPHPVASLRSWSLGPPRSAQ
ncbi:MAG: hypothetical protein CM1200mP2_41530 [Planctomycetaceae bacterium]|nr:MAG: hypothetical protein CM1200mP2_41530 [Planctomycetaceae bacterium]